MKPQVFMSKKNGELCIGLRLTIERPSDPSPCMTSETHSTYIVTWSEQIGYALFHDDNCLGLFTDEAVAGLPLEHLGDL
jgi:hypothetical protein